MTSRIVEVAVNVPLSRSFHYAIPDALIGQLERGHRVLIPFGPRTATGVCVAFPESTEYARLKDIKGILHADCRFDDHLLQLTRWIADYYHASWGEVLEYALPPSVRAGTAERVIREIAPARSRDEIAAEIERVSRRAPARARALEFLASSSGALPRARFLEDAHTTPAVLKRLITDGWAEERRIVDRPDPYRTDAPLRERAEPELNAEQRNALERVIRALDGGTFHAMLLHGVTGSGKTEVYIRALRRAIEHGRRGLVLVPEIALTPQTVQRFREGLSGARVAVLHSMLTPAERTGQWREIQEGKAHVVIGARSAAFAPMPDLGLIVVDEEHESSYKQDSSPRYNARDVAVVRARMLGIPIVLGSATPSLESAHNARTAKYELVELPRRATVHDLPNVSIIPLEPSFYRPDGSGLLTKQLDYQIRHTLEQGEQALVFLNRRGFATFLHCVRCGFVMKCADCDVSLTFHRKAGLARCHYCGSATRIPDACPDCSMPGPRKSGVGTEKVVASLERRFPSARIARIDRDTITSHQTLKQTLARFTNREYDILVGTQMIAKGHDFPGVSLVGILLADTGLHMPDFRSAERTFQLITQVAGRAGRGDRPGRVIVQTFFPEHYAIRAAADGNYRGFIERELESRRTFGYPPFGRLVRVLVSGVVEERVRDEAKRIGDALRAHANECQVLGPVPAPIAKIQMRHRAQILVKSRRADRLHELLAKCAGDLMARRRADIAVDVDPQSLL